MTPLFSIALVPVPFLYILRPTNPSSLWCRLSIAFLDDVVVSYHWSSHEETPCTGCPLSPCAQKTAISVVECPSEVVFLLPISSRMDWFVRCSFQLIRNMCRYDFISKALILFLLLAFKVHVSHPYVATGHTSSLIKRTLMKFFLEVLPAAKDASLFWGRQRLVTVASTTPYECTYYLLITSQRYEYRYLSGQLPVIDLSMILKIIIKVICSF